MESSGMPLDIIVYAIVALAFVVALMRVIGTRSGQERERPNPFAGNAPVSTDATTAAPLKSAPLLVQGTQSTPSSVDAGLVQISLADSSFDPNRFLENAKDAFSLVVGAFADGDRPALKDLLSNEVYESFDAAITAREKTGKKVSTEVVAIREAKIIEAGLKGTQASIVIRFKADESYVETDADGKVTAGNPDRLVTMTDVWVFGRDVRFNDPRWFVTETRDDVKEENAPSLPEAKSTTHIDV